MKMEQAREWAKAQSITLSVDLVTAAKNQLKFLAAVDRKRYLYEGPALERAIYRCDLGDRGVEFGGVGCGLVGWVWFDGGDDRVMKLEKAVLYSNVSLGFTRLIIAWHATLRYNAFWLPLLAKNVEDPVSDDPLVVPLDCEWIWHCHRLNPVRYKSDCEKLFGRILGNHSVISSIHGTSTSKSEEIWNAMYPEEPYELDYNKLIVGDVSFKNTQCENFTTYDLVSAVKRQVPFYYQISRAHVSDDQFLREASDRYKGFLYLIKTNMKKNIKHFSVPTYDVDLMWHSHQLHPISYNDDICELVGKVLEHDDTSSDKTKGSKLDIGYTGTTKQWEDTFGLRYWKAGTMYRGTAPTPVTQVPFPSTYEQGKKSYTYKNYDDLIQFSDTKSTEVLLEFVEIKNLPEGHKGDLRVSFSKKQPDKFFNTKRTLTILSESKEKQVSYIQCEPNGEFLFELVCCSPSNIPLTDSSKPFGSCSLSLQKCLAPGSRLFMDKWLPVVPVSGILTSKPILLHVSLSFTPPTLAPQVFHLMPSQHNLNGFRFSSLSSTGKVKHTNGQTCVTNTSGTEVLSLQMRDLSNDMTRSTPELLKEVVYITESGETHTLAGFKGNEWSINGTDCSSKLLKASENDGYLFELVGHGLVRLYSGRKLDYEPKYKDKRSEQDFMTAIEFSAEYPYGRAVAIIDIKHGIFKVKDKRMTLNAVTVAFIILSDILKIESGLAVKIDYEDNIPNHIGSYGACGTGGDCGARCSSDCAHMAACCGQCVDGVDTSAFGGSKGNDACDNELSLV
ncbi:Glycine-rich domain-containing protein 1 [Bienertia sinuspersici]